MLVVSIFRLVLALTFVQTCKCLTIRKDASKDVYKDKDQLQDKNKSKKSVETLYTIENDFNRIRHHGDGYQYYVPDKHVKPHLENPELEDPGINSPLQGVVHQNHNYQNHYTIDPSQLLLQREQALRSGLAANPLLAALILGQTLGLPPSAGAAAGFNHPTHLPINPYVALLLSHYGRYIQPAAALGRHQRGIYGYAAANNYHNNKPFGAYKIYEDAK